jgi:hypothetical protein
VSDDGQDLVANALAAERALDDRLIAALRSDLTAERAEVERLRAAGDALAEVADEWPELVAAWQEARRER